VKTATPGFLAAEDSGPRGFDSQSPRPGQGRYG